MPLTLNVGLSRKVGEPRFGSRGASVQLQFELDSEILHDPDRLRERIRQAFRLAKASVDEELQASRPAPAAEAAPAASDRPGDQNGAPEGHASRNGARTSNQNGARPSPRPATASQVRRILAIVEQERLDLPQLLQQKCAATSLQGLSREDASRLLDELKTVAPSFR